MVGRGVCIALAAAFVLGGCGDGDERATHAPAPTVTTIPGRLGLTPLDPQGVAVVRHWSDALRHGEVDRASSYFAIPSRAFNGDGLVRLDSGAEVRRFNDSLPCGARMIAVESSSGGYFIVTFALTERPGPGSCGAGASGTARTAFRVRAGKITDWIRVGDLPQATGTEA